MPGARFLPHVGVGCQRGMPHAQLVDNDGRLIHANHIPAGRASEIELHLTSFCLAAEPPNRETPQRWLWRTTVGKTRGSNASQHRRALSEAQCVVTFDPRCVRGDLERRWREVYDRSACSLGPL